MHSARVLIMHSALILIVVIHHATHCLLPGFSSRGMDSLTEAYKSSLMCNGHLVFG